MAFLLGKGSAVEWFRQNQNMDLALQRCALPLLSLEATRTKLEQHVPQLDGLSMPIHLIVSSRDDRRPSRISKSHLLSNPTGHYPAIRLSDELYVSSPELVFLQMASDLEPDALRFLGMELCGRYGISDGIVFFRVQACRREGIREQVEAMPSVRGRKRALETLPSIIEGAGSPMEAALAVILSDATSKGGFGLEIPQLNQPIFVEGRARAMWPQDHITPDLLWNEAKIVVEYDSNQSHTASVSIANDALRRDVLQELGYRVVTLTARHMAQPRSLERVAQIVADRLGTSISCSDEEWAGRVALQARMRWLATHPQALLGTTITRDERKMGGKWHSRGQIPVTVFFDRPHKRPRKGDK